MVVMLMGSIIRKKIKGNTYYYYVESKRVDGKPKLVNQKYLGNAEALRDKCTCSLQENALYSDIAAFGDITLLYDLAQRLDIAGMIDRIVPKRKQGVSVGEYILTASLNRAVCPTSKNGLKEWYADTCLPLVTGHRPSDFTAQNFWNNTDITLESLRAIEEAIVEKVVTQYKLDANRLIYDATNFFTYMDTNNESKLAQRGHSKEKRSDLKIIGASLMVTPDHNIPLFHETYPGNRPDAEQFAETLKQLSERHTRVLGRAPDVTIVFDRGNNSHENIKFIECMEPRPHYVGGLTSSQCKDLYDVPINDYLPLGEGFRNGETAYRTTKEVFGREHTIVMLRNPKLLEGQLQGICNNAAKAMSQLGQLQKKLEDRKAGIIKKGKRPSVESTVKNIENILHAEYMKDLFTFSVTEDGEHLSLEFEWHEDLLESLAQRKLGKTAFFTDRDDFTNEEIISAYRSAWHVEQAFRQMKDPDHLAVRPVFHWTDDRICVHIFCCILAYRLCCLIQKELDGMGVPLSIDRILDETAKVKSVTSFFGTPKKAVSVRTFSRSSDIGEQIMEAYRLRDKYSVR